MMKKSVQACLRQLLNKIKLFKHIRIALFVGTILNLINQFDQITTFKFDEINYVKLVITYFVPFLVSVYAAATVNTSIGKS